MLLRSYHTRGRVPFTVRSATADDLCPVIALQGEAVLEGDEYFVRTPAEFDEEREDAESQLLALLNQDNSLWLISVLGDDVVGSLSFYGGEFARIRHVGHFGMVVRSDYRSQGVGTALIETMLLWASENPVIEKLSTTLFTNNMRAINLYTRFGFIAEGRRHREFLISPGRYMDALLLAKWIK
jgi:RimJ/RimL family protein N-acetyltransferase